MRTRLTWICCAVSFLFFTGCASHFGIQDKSLSVPDEFGQTEAAIANAERSPGAAYCPDKIAKAKELGKKGVETYWACRSAEGLAMLAEARKLAKEAEACQPPVRPAPPPPPGRTGTAAPPGPAQRSRIQVGLFRL